MAIFSFPKTLPVPDGGALLLKNGTVNLSNLTRPAPAWPLLINLLRLLKRGAKKYLAKSWCSGFKRPFGDAVPARGDTRTKAGLNTPRPYPDMPANYYYNRNLSERRISPLSRRLISCFEGEQIRQRRRDNYQCLNELLPSIPGIERLFTTLPDHVCPLAFPIIVQDRDAWLPSLRQAGIDAVPWWAGFHQGIDWTGLPEAVFLKQHIITLPIHQDLDEQAVEFIGRTVRHIAASLTG
jgi:hypothetical protein